MPSPARKLLKAITPRVVLRRLRPDAKPLVGKVDFGDLGRTRPISRYFGFERGLPVDRYYIERFLLRHADDIHGRVVEVGDDGYTRRFGGARVTRSDVLHVSEDAPGATIVADLAAGESIAAESFDCVILTETLHLIYDFRAAIATIHRILAPGGTVLATMPGISQVDSGEWRDSWYWAFTSLSARRIFEERFGQGAVSVEAFGNVLAAISFLEGIATQELREPDLGTFDPAYPVCVTVRATKGGQA